MIYSQAQRRRPTLVKLVAWQKWNNVLEILLDDLDILFDDRTKNRLPEEHILHLACQHQAPLQIIEGLSQKFPHSISSAENKGRFPLHIACAKGLEPRAIDFLIKAYPDAILRPDEFGKIPLHYVCESYAYNFRANPRTRFRSLDESIESVVSLLLDESPESTNLEDLFGLNAIEYALESSVNIRVVKILQNASRENWREMRRSNRGKSHDELRRSITSLSSSLSSVNFARADSTAELLDQGQETKLSETKDIDTTCGIDFPEKKVQAARTA